MQFTRRSLALTALVSLALCGATVVVLQFGPHGRDATPAVIEPTAPAARRELDSLASGPAEQRERRADVRELEPEPAAQAPQGELRFVSALDRRAVTGDWVARRLDGGDGEPTNFRSDAAGLASLPEGEWRVETRDAQLFVGQDALKLRCDEPCVVWVLHRGSLAFRLTDPMGRPVAGASAEWFPYSGGSPDVSATRDHAASPRAPSFTARSNEAGELVFGDCPIDSGVAVFLHPEFARRTYWVSAEQPRTIELTLEPSQRPPREVEIVRCGEAAPITPVRLRSTVGSLLASDAGSPGTVAIPAWVDGDEPLVVESAATFRSDFQLSDVGARVSVHGVARLRLLVTGADSTEVSVGLSARCPREDAACATPDFAPSALVRTNVEHWIDCPADSTMVLRARGADGSFAERTVSVGTGECRATLELRPARDRFTVRVVDDAREPLADAWARTPQEPGNTLRVRADADGRLVVPLAAETSVIEVGAPGYVPARIARSLGEDMRSADAEIVLRRARRTCLRAVTPDGAPLAGLVVRLWPGVGSSTEDVGASGGWSAAPRRATTAITGADGRAYFGGAPYGACRVEVMLPEVHRSNELGDTLPLETLELELEPTRDEYVLTVAPPKRICLRVREAVSNLPVESFRIRSCDRGGELDVEGDTWCGWVSSRCAELFVDVPRIGSASLDVAAADSNAFTVVRVEPGVESRVHVETESGTKLSGRAAFQVFRREADGLVAIASLELPMEDGRSRLCLPFGGEVEVGLVSVNGVAVAGRSRPSTIPWTFDAELSFRIDDAP